MRSDRAGRAEIRRRRFAATLANEDATARHNIAGAEQIKALPKTMTQLAAQSSKRSMERGR